MGETIQQVNISVKGIEKRLDSLTQETKQMNQKIDIVGTSVNQMNAELNQLKTDFEKMMNEQRKNAILQKAATELVRVRQEIDQSFGNYTVVRETMLGVLQATDLALVKKTTISRVSEELMLATPRYWLAPCLIAISAWIGNDRDLAERAVKEAIRRDEERTALTMALVCRRNNRTQTCYEWLDIYFSKQKAQDFKKENFVYLDAYVNGVFGQDEKHICDDYINKWLNEIKGGNISFEEKQEARWKEYCKNFTNGIEEIFPGLKENVVEFDQINTYAERINSIDDIKNTFGKIMTAYVDCNQIKEKIDENLIKLISTYNEDELPLRREEKYLIALRKNDGDEEKTKNEILAKENAEEKEILDLVEQMSQVIISDEVVSPSEKKTALSFLNGYIQKGFNSYLKENKELFPDKITLNVNGWKGTTSDGENESQLCSDYEKYMNECCTKEKASLPKNPSTKWIIFTTLSAIVGVLMLLILLPVGVVALALTAYFGYMIPKSKKNTANQKTSIDKKYNDLIEEGKNKILLTLKQWKATKEKVSEFNEQNEINIIGA